MQRRGAVVGAASDVRAGPAQDLDDNGVALGGSGVQRRHSVTGPLVHIDAVLDERTHDTHMPPEGSASQRRQALLCE